MTTKTLYSDRFGTLSIDLRDNGTLRIISSEEFTSVAFNIPAEHVKEVAEKFAAVVTAPAWTRAQFVRVEPKGFAPYAMFRRPDGKWVTDSGHVLTTKSFLECTDPIVFEVIA